MLCVLPIMKNEEDPEIMNGSILWIKDLNAYVCNSFLKDSPSCPRFWVIILEN